MEEGWIDWNINSLDILPPSAPPPVAWNPSFPDLQDLALADLGTEEMDDFLLDGDAIEAFVREYESLLLDDTIDFGAVVTDCTVDDFVIDDLTSLEASGKSTASAETAVSKGKKKVRDPSSGKKRPKKNSTSPTKGLPWSESEHRGFIAGMIAHGKGNWRAISTSHVTTRTPAQVASHAQKFFRRQSQLPHRRRHSILDLASPNACRCLALSHHTTPLSPAAPPETPAIGNNNNDYFDSEAAHQPAGGSLVRSDVPSMIHGTANQLGFVHGNNSSGAIAPSVLHSPSGATGAWMMSSSPPESFTGRSCSPLTETSMCGSNGENGNCPLTGGNYQLQSYHDPYTNVKSTWFTYRP